MKPNKFFKTWHEFTDEGEAFFELMDFLDAGKFRLYGIELSKDNILKIRRELQRFNSNLV